jgi:hypothetical protein
MATSQEILDALQTKIKQDLRVSLPGIIKSYDHKKQMADIDFSPELLADNNINPLKGISGVPVIFPRSGGASITMPVKAGDGCVVIFLDRDARNWLLGKPKDRPMTRRMHTLNDAIAFVGLTPFSAASVALNNTDMHIQYAGSSITLKPDGITEVVAAKQIDIKTPDSNVTIKPDGLIEINAAKKIDLKTKDISINCTEAITIECKNASIKAAEIISAECTNFNIKGALQVEGNITSTAVITGQSVQTTGGVGLDGHTHQYVLPLDPAPAQPGITTTASGGAVATTVSRRRFGDSILDGL